MNQIWTETLRPFLVALVLSLLCGLFLNAAFGYHWGTVAFGEVMTPFMIAAFLTLFFRTLVYGVRG